MYFKCFLGVIIVSIHSSFMIQAQSAELQEAEEEQNGKLKGILREKRQSLNCNTLQFTQHSIGNVTIYVSTTNVTVNWYEAVCCCRSRNQDLLSPTSIEFMDNIKTTLNTARDIMWTDVYANNGTWRHLFSGEKLQDDNLHWAKNQNPDVNRCMEVSRNYRLNSITCDTKWDEAIICQTRETENCYPLDLEPLSFTPCNKDAILAHGKENVCPRKLITTTEEPTTPTTTTPSTTTTPTPKETNEDSCSSVCCNCWNWCDFFWNMF